MLNQDEYNDHLRMVEYCVSNQEYIIESSSLFIDSLTEERDTIIDEGKRIKDKSFKFIEFIGEDSKCTTDFASTSKMFAKFFEIVGHLISQNYSSYQKQTNYTDLQDLAEELKDFNQEINKSTIVEQLKKLNKMKLLYHKKKVAYEKAVSLAEQAITRSEEVNNDPTLAYDLSIKESSEEKAISAMKNLDFSKEEL